MAKSKLDALKAVYQWVTRTMMKDQTGVMQTLPNRDLIELNTQITAQRLMQAGVDPTTLKNANQVENAINIIENRPVQEGIKSTKVGKVLDMEGQEIPQGSRIIGGKAVKETEEEILARMNKENKETVEKIKQRKFDEAIKKEKDKMLKDEDYIPEIIDPEDMATGGRAGFADGPDMPGRRKFMKIMGGIATLPLVGKYLKPAMPLIQKGAEITGPALDKIIQTVMSAGKLISQSGRRVKEMVTKKKLKDVEVEEDIMDGPSYTIKTRDKTIYYKPGRQDEMGIEDDIIEVIEDTVTKKAGGGIARMLGE
tara:strand:- start:2189 stop:3118 length:930 start_codon:yes stop_codon:yes gene_type:complete